MSKSLRKSFSILTAIAAVFTMASSAQAAGQEIGAVLSSAAATRVLGSEVGARLVGAVIGREAAASFTSVAARRAALQSALAQEGSAALREQVIAAITELNGAAPAQATQILSRVEAQSSQLRRQAEAASAGREGSISVASLVSEPAANAVANVPHMAEVDSVLAARAARNEISAADLAAARAGLSAAAALDPAVIGSGAKACLQRFSAAAVGKYTKYVAAYNGARSIAAAWTQKIAVMAREQGKSIAEATRNGCGLTEGAPDSECTVYGTAFAPSCR